MVPFEGRTRGTGDGAQVEGQAATARCRVLVADRPGDGRAALVRMLAERGLQVEVADDARMVARRLDHGRGAEAVDLVVWGFDPRDPETEVAAPWLARGARVRALVLLTTRGWLATAAAAQRLGATAVLRRPLQPQALEGALQALVP